MIGGAVESVTEFEIRGWAHDLVEIREGSVLLESVTPNLPRQGPGKGFVYSVPARCRDGAEHQIHLRSVKDSMILEGSPVRIRASGESALIPFHTSEWTGRSVLVLAPHPDDETLGCGGSLLLHRNSGDSVKVIFLTDGGAGGDVAIRESEARNACQKLGVESVDFWAHPDRQLQATDDVVDRLVKELKEWNPELIYCPSPWEYHPDHRATFELLMRAGKRLGLGAEVLLYELGRPLPVNALVDISTVIAELTEICQVYQSQLERVPYDQLMEGIDRYRSHTVSSQGVTHCEGYYHLPFRDIGSGAWQALPLGPCRLEAPRPEGLVSVVVRTRDRTELLHEALRSLAAQTYPRIEVVVVNDGGGTVADLVSAFEPCFAALHHLELENSVGRSAAANKGFSVATGRYLAMLDDDDLLYPEHVAKLVGFLQATGERFAYSDCDCSRYRWEGNRFVELAAERPFHSKSYDRDDLYFENSIPNMCAMFRKDLWEEAGPFDPDLKALEDWDLWLRMAERTSLCHLPGVTAEYRIFGDRDYDFHQSTVAVYRKHAHYWSVENLAKVSWPGLRALKTRVQELEAEVQRLRRPYWKRLLNRVRSRLNRS